MSYAYLFKYIIIGDTGTSLLCVLFVRVDSEKTTGCSICHAFFAGRSRVVLPLVLLQSNKGMEDIQSL